MAAFLPPSPLRARMLDRLAGATEPFDLLVIGGGAPGFAAALDALTRGLSVALVERGDFGEGTSSRSTKLIHGGVRYLRQGRLGLVRESLHERSWFLRAAPFLVQPLEFVIPCSSSFWKAYYRIGMAAYDRLAGAHQAGPSRALSRDEVLARAPGCAADRLAGGVRYIDGQFDDARMIMCFLRETIARGGVAANYADVVALAKENGRVRGAEVIDRETGRSLRVNARAVLNATGVFIDQIARLDQPAEPERIAASQGSHLVLDASFLGGASALMIPKTSDGRVLFAIPWHGRTLYGTTDTPVARIDADPQPLAAEIDYLLDHARHIFARPPTRADVIASFAGLRPLPKPRRGQRSSAVSRDFKIDVAPSGLVSIYGGKWTTCRAMGEAAVERALAVAGLAPRPSRTRELVFTPGQEPASHLEPPSAAWTRYAIEHEMARTTDDLLLRRCRVGILNPPEK